ncbi:MAG: tRNA pseudouridine(38-40) synthase TruA [Actinomycetota bacterium]
MGVTRLDIEYDGSRFSGWAAQPGHRTVQGELEAALATILRAEVSLTVAGRTDAGVHAWGQVASFESDAEIPGDLLRRLNGVLPDDVAVTAVEAAADGFDARRDARSRTYCYRVLTRPSPSPFERGRALWWPYPLDSAALDRCAAELPGTHDFTAFTPTDTDHVRFEREVTRAEWLREDDILAFWVEADAFMRNMVRVLVRTMLEVGGGRREIGSFASLLDGASRADAGETAPPHGLYLASVRY